LYFAEREKTAEGYRKAGTGSRIKIDGEDLLSPKSRELAIKDQEYNNAVGFLSVYGDADQAMRAAADNDLPEVADRIKSLVDSGRITTTGKGSMYEVNIAATPDEFIDWDLPLDEQSESVMNALNKTDWYQYAEEGAYNAAERRGDNAYGMDLVRWLEEDGAEDAVQMLKDAGIKGVQYADAQTRFGKGPKTKNYVVYDDKLISISKEIRRQYTRSRSHRSRHHDTGRKPAHLIYKPTKVLYLLTRIYIRHAMWVLAVRQRNTQ
jgi:hypothetical protein